jgi:hypothetical protein
MGDWLESARFLRKNTHTAHGWVRVRERLFMRLFWLWTINNPEEEEE